MSVEALVRLTTPACRFGTIAMSPPWSPTRPTHPSASESTVRLQRDNETCDGFLGHASRKALIGRRLAPRGGSEPA